MRAYRARRLGGPQSLSVEEVEPPRPGPGEVLIAVEAAGLHLADLAALAGERVPSPSLPFTPGLDVAGTVAELGEGVESLKPGDRVAAFVHWGGLAERVVARAALCIPIPADLAAAQAAALPFAFGGALLALQGRAGLGKGETLLVLGAGGNAGLAAVRIGALLGANVIGAATGELRKTQSLEHGAVHIVDPGVVALGEAVRKLTDGRGADVVFDPVGGEGSGAALNALAEGGRFISAGFASGRPPAFDLVRLFQRAGRLFTANTVVEVERDPQAAGAALRRLVDWVAEKRFEPRVAAQFSFAEMGPAFDYVASRKGTGAVIVKVRN